MEKSFPISDASSLASAKRELRGVMKKKRDEAYVKNPAAALALRDNFLKSIPLPPQSVVASYSAHGSEINPAPLIETLRAQGHIIALPVVTGIETPLSFRIYNPNDNLVAGPMRILEPVASASVIEPNILLVPLLAFDQHGYRLGYGGGHYDRTLATLRHCKTIFAVGIAFACQEVPLVPIGPHDTKLDRIVTEIQAF